MLRDAHATGKGKQGRVKPVRSVRFPGLINAAAALGVHRNHLYLVLSGQRKSRRLLSRYQQLKGTR
jgi:hypothetical protein